MGMHSDLTFKDPALEAAYFSYQAAQQLQFEINFHYARALAWAAVGVRAVNIALGSREPWHWVAATITILGAITTVLPSFAHRLPPAMYLRWRVPIIFLDNILQVGLGCYTHETIYPETGVTSVFKSAFVLLSGNGVAWLLFSGLWGSLIFKYMFPQQAVLVIILLVYNRTLCHRSAALVHAYESIKRVVGRRLWALVPQSVLQWAGEALRALLSSGGAAGTAGAAAAGAAGCGSGGACTALDWMAECLGLGPGGASSGACPLVSGEALCLLAQPFTQLAVGFLLPTLFVYARELQDRRAFARRYSRTPEGRRCNWGWLDQQEHGLGLSLVDYALFGLPACAALYAYVVVADYSRWLSGGVE